MADTALAPIAALWAQLQDRVLPGHALVRCYANAHTFGIEGYPHVDSRKPGNVDPGLEPCGSHWRHAVIAYGLEQLACR